VCGGSAGTRFHEAVLEFSAWHEQDPEIAAYTGETVWLRRCGGCGFAQPERIPALPGYFARMYDQQWSPEWVAEEFDSPYKDMIFQSILATLGNRVPARSRTLLDIGCHAGRFLRMAADAGWRAEGTEINERTATHAAHRTGVPVHRLGAGQVGELGRRFDAVVLTDVLEHIPEPVALLEKLRTVVTDNGWIAVKVPCGPAQLAKETWRARLSAGYRATIADNLVHINHFSPAALRLALDRAGFDEITVAIAAPECPPGSTVASWFRVALYHIGRRVPGGIHTPIALHLQAYARAATRPATPLMSATARPAAPVR
jgi:2-polyprenyl-3-methyl-5-hydroxy-6-metoxy-1,4-benzoquinol methylase